MCGKCDVNSPARIREFFLRITQIDAVRSRLWTAIGYTLSAATPKTANVFPLFAFYNLSDKYVKNTHARVCFTQLNETIYFIVGFISYIEKSNFFSVPLFSLDAERLLHKK